MYSIIVFLAMRLLLSDVSDIGVYANGWTLTGFVYVLMLADKMGLLNDCFNQQRW